MSERVDLGHGVWLSMTCWRPDRALNPQYDGIADVPRLGAVFHHAHADGKYPGVDCMGHVTFDTPEARAAVAAAGLNGHDVWWQVQSWEPLTISPSVLCRECGAHGYIREGRWVPA